MKEKDILVENQSSRNYQTGTLYQLLCDRYNVSYYTSKEKILELVTEELNF